MAMMIKAMKSISLILLAKVSFFSIASLAADSLSGKRPNIIIVMTDDQGYGDLSSSGHPYIKTPHIDRLRKESMRFEDFQVSSSCAPTRAAMMSGVHPFKVGVTHTIFHRELMDLKRKTMAEVMREAGYATGIFGKWHLGDSDPYQPHKRGFDESLIHGGGIAGSSGIRTNGSYFDMLIRHNGKFVQTKGFCTDVFFGQAMHWMKQRHDEGKPFLACVFPNAPHGPFNAPEKYLKLYEDVENAKHREKAGFFGMISNIDDNMGLLIKKLDDWDMAKDTILIFMTDNGSVATSVYDGGMRGGKTSVHEGGSRVPFFIRWPGRIKADQDVEVMARHYDLLPTFADLAGADVSELDLDGKSLVPLMANPDSAWETRYGFFHKGRWGNLKSKHEKHRRNPGADNNKFNTFAVRNASWRLTVNKGVDRDLELHHIIEDSAQKNDVSKEHPEVVQEMLKAYGAWWDECRPLMVNEERDIDEKMAGWRDYLKEQQTAEGVPDLIIPSFTSE